MKFISALVAACVLSASLAYAGIFSAIACTKDHKSVALKIELKDSASAKTQSNIRLAFHKAATSLTYDELITKVGFQAFHDGLLPETLAEIVQIPAPPTTFGDCK